MQGSNFGGCMGDAENDGFLDTQKVFFIFLLISLISLGDVFFFWILGDFFNDVDKQ